ncbi:hypothetical protein ACFLRM_06495 [Acidobacteriota bacterium]
MDGIGMGFNTAVFIEPAYTITASVDPPEGGMINPWGEEGVVEVNEGEDSQEYSIQAQSGWHIKEVFVDGESLGRGANRFTLDDETGNMAVETAPPNERITTCSGMFNNVSIDHTLHPEFEEDHDYVIAVYYALPSDSLYNPDVIPCIKEAALRVQSWYKCATYGRTFKFAFPEIARLYYGDLTAQEYYVLDDIYREMKNKGLPKSEAPYENVIMAVWLQDSHCLAFAYPETNIAGISLNYFPEFNNPQSPGKQCQLIEQNPEGVFAHELGHLFGAPNNTWDEAYWIFSYHTVMGAFWEFPYGNPDCSPYGFLKPELNEVFQSPFMHEGVEGTPYYSGCTFVDLPQYSEWGGVNVETSKGGSATTLENDIPIPSNSNIELQVPKYSSLSFRFYPNQGWILKELEVNGTVYQDPAKQNFTLKNIQYPQDIRIVFSSEEINCDGNPSIKTVEPANGFVNAIWPGSEVIVDGKHFGNEKGSVYIEYYQKGRLKNRNCRILHWEIAHDCGGVVMFKVPGNIMPGSYDLLLKTKKSRRIARYPITIEQP